MKFNKFISGSIIAIALLGTTLVGKSSIISVNANNQPMQGGKNNPGSVSSGSVANGQKETDNNNAQQGSTVSKDFITKNGATVNITDGYLNLDSTPQFNFGNNKKAVNDETENTPNNNTLNLSSNNSGNENNQLAVTDYRASSNNASNPTNWSLSATVGPFNSDSSSNNDSNNWSIDFLDNSTNSDMSKTTTGNKQNVQSNSNDRKDIVDGSYGQSKLDYTNKVNLIIPYNVKPGNYSADINWNLSTNINNENEINS